MRRLYLRLRVRDARVALRLKARALHCKLRGKPQTAEEALAVLREFFDDRTSFGERDKLWSVLTALRGPDDVDADVKAATTAVIRHADVKAATTAVIRHAVFGERLGGIGVVSNRDQDYLASRRASVWKSAAERGSGHFLRHAGAAFTALGLDWNKFNQR